MNFTAPQSTFADSYPPAWVFAGHDVPTVRDGAIDGGVHAGYLHTHPARTRSDLPLRRRGRNL